MCDGSSGNVRNGQYSARVIRNPGDRAFCTCKAEAEAIFEICGLGSSHRKLSS